MSYPHVANRHLQQKSCLFLTLLAKEGTWVYNENKKRRQKMKYKTELHCHSKEGSGCASETVERIVEKYVEAGYTTICLTNHLIPPKVYDYDAWVKKIEKQYSAFDLLKETAGDKLIILLAFEIRINTADHLLFGFDKEFLLNNYDLFVGDIATFSKKARGDGMFLAQAHPFRPGVLRTDPELLDGIEVFNGHPEQNSHNELAEQLAIESGKIMLSGTDHHDPHHIPNGGISTDVPVTTIPQLIEIFKSGDYELLRG